MAKKRLTPDNNKSQTTVTKIGKPEKFKYFDDHHDLFTGRMMPIPESFIEQVGKDLLLWSMNYEDEKAATLEQFIRSKGIPSRTWYNWLEKSPLLKMYHEEAKAALGDKRETRGLNGQWNAAMVMFSMPDYSERWKKNVEWRASLNKDKEDNQTKIVVIETTPSSPLVEHVMKQKLTKKDE